MTTPERVNSEVILKAAQMAKPESKFFVEDGHVYDYVRRNRNGNIIEWTGFDPLTSDADAMKLERALKGDGWKFSQDYIGKRYKAELIKYTRDGFTKDIETDESDTLLLLRCVSAMHNLSLYTIVSQDGGLDE